MKAPRLYQIAKILANPARYKRFISDVIRGGIKLNRAMSSVKKQLEPRNYTFEDYLIEVGMRSNEYAFSKHELFANKKYFKYCYEKQLSPYKALLFMTL